MLHWAKRLQPKHQLIFVVILAIALVIGLLYLWIFGQRSKSMTPAEVVIANFEQCAAAGYAIMESYPERCQTPGGSTFTRNIGNELEKFDLIQAINPRPGQVITSPIIITGQARGYWFFEASFHYPGQLLAVFLKWCRE